MIEDNIGSLLIQGVSTPTFILTQGFIQPDAGTSNTIPPINDVVLDGGFFILDAMGETRLNEEENAMMEFSVGETFSRTYSNPNNMLTQGVLQPYGRHWIGVINTDWVNGGNWSPGIVPTAKDDAYISPNCTYYPILTSGINGQCKNLILLVGSSVQVKAGATLTTHQL